MRVAVVTSTRAEYGVLRWTLEAIRKSSILELKLIVIGSHLDPSQGLTVGAIRDDGFVIDEEVHMAMASGQAVAIAKSMGLCALGIAESLERLHPGVLLVVGDRYELLPVCSAALVMGIPIAHISGGDVTEGAIDDQIRHAISKLSTVHFVGNKRSATRLLQMGESPDQIHVVGEPGLENFQRLSAIPRLELAKNLDLDPAMSWVLVTWHPETRLTVEENQRSAKEIELALDSLDDVQSIVTYANSDLGGAEINQSMAAWASRSPSRVRHISSLGQLRYFSLMREVGVVVGNSSSGVLEAPSVPVRSVDVGDRQKGRHQALSVKKVSPEAKGIRLAVEEALQDHQKGLKLEIDTYYGDGNTSGKIVRVLEACSKKSLEKAPFVDLENNPELSFVETK